MAFDEDVVMEDLKIPVFLLALCAAACVESPTYQSRGPASPSAQMTPTPYAGQGGYLPPGSGGQINPSVYPTYPTPTPTYYGSSGTSNPSLIEFHIPAGTGSGPWNSAAAPVDIKLPSNGNSVTLRIINDDVTEHVLHTNGDPCPHQDISSPLQKGESYDCVIRAPFDSTADGVLYDHNMGEGAWFYVRARK